jgi:hypothetical protein
MDNQPEVILHQMEETRTSLTEKIEQLEKQVAETVHGAASAVTETVENVKESVKETVDTVKDAFNLSHQVERHPWAMFGGSVALGYLGAVLTSRPAESRHRANGYAAASDLQMVSARDNGAAEAAPRRGLLESVGETFGTEIDKLKELAIGVAAGVLRDTLTSELSETIRPQLAEVIDDITIKLGGKPLPKPATGQGAGGPAHGRDGPPQAGYGPPQESPRQEQPTAEAYGGRIGAY